MKKLSTFLIAIIAIISFNSCSENDDFTFEAQQDPDGITFINSISESYTLTQANKNSLGERFVWNKVNFDVPTTVRYELQASTSTAFDNITLLAQDIAETNYAVTIGDMLDLAEEANLDNDPETDAPNTGNLYFKIRAYTGAPDANNVVEQFSEPIALTIVLPEGEAEEVFQNFFLVGDATAAGWGNNNNNTPLFRDGENPDLYHFTGRFTLPEDVDDQQGFKLLETLGAWQPQWGLDGDNLTSSEILGEDPIALPVPADAYYSFIMNIDEMTWAFEPYDASAAATYDVIGLVGDGTSVGWPNDTDNTTPDIKMTKSTFDAHIWNAQGVELTDGEVKFRANLAWDTSWGGGDGFPSGIATGDNIKAKAGTYNVWFNDLTGRYIFIPVVI
jgi:hypothetical protein